MVDLWRTWGEYTGLNESASALGWAIDQLAVSAGLEHQGQLRKIYDTGSEAEIAVLEERFSADLVEIADDALAEFGLCLGRLFDRREASDEATVFVRDTLQLPWPWLAAELKECFGDSVVAFASGRVMGIGAWAEEPLAPEVAMESSTLPGEIFDQALNRMCESLPEGIVKPSRSSEEGSDDRGIIPADEEAEFRDGVGKYARWFYRNRLCGESIRHITQSDHYDPATIRRGIDEAE